jgi:import inner membrane translocase subunit TIM21
MSSFSIPLLVKENVKTSAYGGVILLGIAVTGAMGYVILKELFSSESAQSIYSQSFKLIQLNPEVEDALGAPIKCYGEENSRGRRRHIS